MDLQTQRLMMAAAGAGETKPYIDDVFSTDLYKSTSSSADYKVTNNLDNSGEGAMLWYKERNGTSWYLLWDTERGSNKYIYSNSDSSESTSELLKSFDSDGYTIKGGTTLVGTSRENVLWNFRKAPGFFDVVTYTGNGTAGRTLSHSLGCVPGLVLIKQTNSTQDWVVYHCSLDTDKKLKLNGTDGEASTSSWNSTRPTSTTITLGSASGVNASSQEFVAYVFAGGEEGYNSVKFDGSGDYLLTSSGSDYTFGTGDFTVEHWFKTDNWATSQMIDGRMNGSSYQTNWCTYIESGKTYRFFVNGDQITSSALADNTWYHAAVVRNSGTTTLYINGVSQGTYSDSNDYDNTQITVGIHGPNRSSFPYEGKISNLRVVKGTAVYTSAFTAPTAPLSNVTNTKLICCNGTSTTSTTVGNISEGGNPNTTGTSPFTSADSVFGENEDQNVIKCGSYVGNGSSTGPEINLGWEPQWVLIKHATSGNASPWSLWDSMRGMVTDGNDNQLYPNQDQSEYTGANRIDLTSTGFKIFSTSHMVNTNNSTYVYICIRRPDGYVGKPAELGNQVFTPVFGSANAPMFKSNNHVVDFTLQKNSNFATQSTDWNATARLISGQRLIPNTTSAQISNQYQVFDYQSGTSSYTGGSGIRFAWMFKRHAGLDIVNYTGNATARSINHGLNAVPEMIWAKKKNSTGNWYVYHKGVNGGSSSVNYFLQLDTADTQQNVAIWNITPTSSVFHLSTDGHANSNGDDFIAMLFASVDGISKVGSYTGSASSQTISLGFQPRFLIVKKYTGSPATHWYVLDTVRGWGSGDDKYLELSSTAVEASHDFGAPTSTGMTLPGGEEAFNASGSSYIYYAHA
jgi:hypothetical protein